MIRDLFRLLRTESGPQKAEPGLVLVGDGCIPTVELARQVISNMPHIGPMKLGIGPEFYAAAAATAINPSSDYVLVRTGEPGSYPFVQRLRAMGMPYSYVIDDNFWLLLDESLPIHQLYQNPFVRRALEYTISGADVVLCHSEHFRKFLLHFNSNVAVVPASFDFSVLEDAPPPVAPENEVRIGVVANSSRSADMALLVPVIHEVLGARPIGVVFEFFGFTPEGLEGLENVRSLPHVADYAEYIRQKYGRGWLLGLAPLIGNRFAEYKTNNKLREFGACSVATIYSDVAIYRESVEHGVTGWVVPNDTQSWTTAILSAIANAEATRAIGRNAREYVERHHHIKYVAATWQKALGPTFSKRTAFEAEIRRAQRRVGRWERGTVDHPQICTSTGPVKSAAPGEADGFIRRDTIFPVGPGESIASDALAPLCGEYRWSVLLATYGAVLEGALKVHVAAAGKTINEKTHNLRDLADGAVVAVCCTVPEAGRVRVTVTNEGSATLALYGLGSLSQTQFSSNGKLYPPGFVA